MTTEIVIVLILILVNGLFAMGELAVVSSRKARLKQLADEGQGSARIALDLASDPTRFLSTIQIGMTVVSVLTGTFGGAAVAQKLQVLLNDVTWISPYAETVSLGLVVIVISYLTLILGELVPKRLALVRPEAISMRLSGFLRILERVASPAAWFLSLSTNLVLRLLPGSAEEQGGVTDEEIKILMAEGAEAGQFLEAEKAIVGSTLRLGDRRVSALMTPRTRMEVLDLEDPAEETHRKMRETHYSRFPVIEGDSENVIGIVHAKDLLVSLLDGRPLDIRTHMRPPTFIPDSAPAFKALELFKQSGSPITLIVDEYGDIEGLLTLNDIMEALVGDIANSDEEQPPAVQRDDGSWLVDGMVSLDELRDLLSLGHRLREIEDTDTQTLGGYMMERLKRIPAAADHVDVDGYRFEVVDMDGRRVDKVLIVPPEE